MRQYLIACMMCVCSSMVLAQPKQAATLLVYSLKGKATLLDGKTEVPVKIGQLLKYGAVLRVKEETKMVLVCPQGRAISLQKKGSYPVNRWNDTCRLASGSVSNEYFRYVWSQMTGRDYYNKDGTDSHRASGLPDDIGGVVRDVPPPPPMAPIDRLLLFSGGDFPLEWSGVYGTPYYTVELTDDQGQLLHSDTSSVNMIMLSRFLPYMSPGKQYFWQVSSPTIRAGARAKLRYVTRTEEESLVREIGQASGVPETEAEKAFRTAFMLEKRDFLVAAADWYRRAAGDPQAKPLFQKKWMEFRLQHRMPDAGNGNQ